MQRPDRYEGSSLAQSASHALLSLLPHFHILEFAAEKHFARFVSTGLALALLLTQEVSAMAC